MKKLLMFFMMLFATSTTINSQTKLAYMVSFDRDSIKGFKEVEAKKELLDHQFVGSEFFVALNNMKRQFINKKYKIGSTYVPNSPSTPNSYGYRPGNGGNQTNLFPCVNEDFELTTPGVYNTGNAVAGWTVESGNNGFPGYSCGGAVTWVAGSPEFSIVATPIGAVLPVGTTFNINNVSIPNSPLGGTNVARLNDCVPGTLITRLRSTFPVTSANTLFQFAYCGSWDGNNHGCCEQPSFNIRMFNCPGVMLSCSSISLTPGVGCGSPNTYSTSGIPPILWTNWVVNSIDLTPFIGTCVTIEVTNSDCNGGAHHGSAYFDSRCGGALISPGLGGVGGSTGGAVSFCAGANQAQLQAPLGYQSYQWFAPGNPPVAISPTLGGTSTLVTIPNPIAGSVYTVALVTVSGCSYTAVDTLNFTTVQIVGLGTTPSCPGGASGSATVQGNGSGTGYNYTWTPSGSPISIGTSSTISGLLPGTYSVIITGFGAAGCGADTATVNIGTSPPNVYTVYKPFCGSQAYLTSSGSNFQWYQGLTPVSATNGGTLSSLTVNSPYHGQSYWLTYTSPQGCRDSVNFILQQTPSGSMYVQNTTYACVNQSNGSANIIVTPAMGAPSGISSYSVWSNAPTPAYTSSIFPTSSNSYSPTGMAAGSYDVTAFDGACYYSSSFTINNYVYNYAVTPITSTLCPGGSIYAGVSFNNPIVPGQYNFSWSPSTYVVGGSINTSNIAIQIAPTIPTNSVVTTIYSITVVPTIVNCPLTKTISVTAVNLQIPSITSPQPFCNNVVGLKTITVSPQGTSSYTFSSGMFPFLANGSFNPQSLTTFGTNTFVVSTSIGTCVVSNVGSISISQFNSAAITGTIPNQCVTYPCTNLMSIVPNQTGIWSGVGINSNTFCPTNLVTGLYTLSYNTVSNPNTNLCPDTRTLSVLVTQTVTPFITPKAPFCTNIPSFNMTASPSGGVWSSSVSQLISPSGVVNPAFAPMGNTTINYVVSTGACVNNASTVLNATQFWSAALTNSISNMCVNSTPFNLINIVQNPLNGAWSGPGVSNNIFTPSNLSTGHYTLYYNTTSTPNPVVCPDSRSIVVYVLNPALPTITQPSTHCNTDAPFQIVATPNTGSFVPTNYLTSGGVFTPSLSSIGNNFVQYVIGTSTCNVQDTKQINIEAFVPSTITGSVSDQCNTNGAVNLMPITQFNSGVWSGSGILGSNFNPSSSNIGSVIITYNTSSVPSGLCPSQSTLAINVFSLAAPSVLKEGPYCNSHAPFKLRATPIGGVFSGMNNTAVDFLGIFNPPSATIGSNIVNYSITSGPCTANTQVVIEIEKFISADFDKYSGPFCKNEKSVDLSTSVQNPGGVFSGPGINGNNFNPANANVGGNLILYNTHSTPTYSLCPDTKSISIHVNPVPVVSITSNLYDGCSPVSVMLNSPNVNDGRGAWTLGDGTDTIRGLSINHTYSTPGTYSIVFNYWDNLGCSTQASLVNPIVVYEMPVASFNYTTDNGYSTGNPEVDFINLSTVLGKNKYQWNIDELYTLTDLNPSVIFPKPGKYTITLTATTINGCKDITSKVIEIRNEFGIFIPNSFTPNYDNINDVFIPVFTTNGFDPSGYEMDIFDRWGHLVFQSKDMNKGWPGTIPGKSDELIKQEVYIYKIKYRDVDGNSYSKMGHVSLIR